MSIKNRPEVAHIVYCPKCNNRREGTVPIPYVVAVGDAVVCEKCGTGYTVETYEENPFRIRLESRDKQHTIGV